MGFILILCVLQINLGLIDLGGKKEGLDRGTFDFTLDMYFGLPLGLKTKTIGDTAYTHYYEWINARRGGFKEGEDVYRMKGYRNPQ